MENKHHICDAWLITNNGSFAQKINGYAASSEDEAMACAFLNVDHYGIYFAFPEWTRSPIFTKLVDYVSHRYTSYATLHES